MNHTSASSIPHSSMRAICGIVIIIVFIARLIYRAIVLQDPREKPDELYLGLGFIAAWALVYLFINLA